MRVAILTTDMRESVRGCTDPQPRIGVAPEALLQGFALLPEVEVHVVSCLKEPLPSPEKLAPNIFYHGLVVPRLGWLRTGYQGCIRATRTKLKEIQPDIVHGQGTERNCAISAIFSGFPNVITIHGNMRAVAAFYRSRPGSFHWLTARLESFTLRRTRGVFCNSAYTENLVASCALRTWRVANALRPEFFAPMAETRIASKPILLNVGSFLPYKRQRELLALAGNLWRQGLKFELHFVGSRSDRTEYDEAFARELAVAEKAGYARHLGLLATGELIAAMDHASALVHVPTEEAFGLVVAEALARNLKFFGSNVGGVPDIARDVESAELFAPDDWDGLGNAISRWILADYPRPMNASMSMHERYHPLVIARRHLEVYREVLALKPEH